MNISDMLESQAAALGPASAIILQNRKLTFEELNARVWQLAGQLRRCGVGRGDVLAHTFDSELDLFCCMMASARIGATVFSLPLNTPLLKRQQLLQQVRARHLATDMGGLQYSGISRILIGSEGERLNPTVPEPGLKDEDPPAPWIIVSGSGSTGRAKLLPITHRQQWARMKAGQGLFPYAARDVFASLIPLDFYTTKMRFLEALTKGTPFVLHDKNCRGVADLVDRFKVTALYGTVMHAEQLLQSLPASTQAAMESLTALMLIGSTVSANLRHRIRERLCSRLCVLYGTNESGTLCATEWQDVYQVPGTVGRPQSGFRLEVVDDDDAPVPAGQPGQVRIQSPTMIDGYLDDELATARAFKNGWFYPGDLGRLTPDGQLIHLGRSDDMMIVNGINIYPAEIEQVLTAHPAVREAAAMPLKHAVHQDVPVCAVSLVEGARVDAQALLSFARERLGGHALHQVVMLDRIPRNDRGKPDREELKATIALRLGRLANAGRPEVAASGVPKASPAKQMQRPFRIAFDVPEQAHLARLDAWLAEALQIDLAAAKELALLSEPVGADSGRAWTWLSRCLLLARALLQAARIPVFDPPEIRSIEPMGGGSTSWQGQVTLARIDHLSRAAYETAINAAFRLGAWANEHELSHENLKVFFTLIEDPIVAPLSRMLLTGKSTMPVLQAAHAKGVPFRHLGLGVFQLGWGARARCVDRSTTVLDSAMGAKLSQDKVATGGLLRSAGLPAAVHAVAATYNDARRAARRIGWPVVVKPIDRDRGEGVAVDVADDQVLRAAFDEAVRHSKAKQAIIEQQVEGVCHRLFVRDGQLLYAVKRMPMSVTGNGRQTVAELVAREFETQQRLPPWTRSAIRPLDAMALAAMAAAGFTASSIPVDGTRVPLRRIESTEWGGVDEEVTQRIHPENLRVALAASALFGLNVAGIDIISQDISQPWHENGAIINEVNFAPLLGGAEISRQHVPAFLDSLIQGDGRIPVEVFVGGGDAFRAATARWQSLRSGGVRAVLTNGKETFSASGESWPMPFGSVYQVTRALTLSPLVAALVVVISADDFLRLGLPLETVDAVTKVDDAATAQAA
ncbi:MAG: AMP-dependent synthetase and ligase [Ramlibacter sp.]|jgi:acyl-coenzyme A synthetase/AMP-(fatty) acid ligase/D-alanine-D-alanine ligase-like ATP-grasp enzyme|nr:AMP-dependent synthetase and ligase [Ramlibacter sp.]